MSETTVTFAEVLLAARLGRARIAPEIAGYLALGVADALFKNPQLVDERSCWLTDEGAIFTTAPVSPGAGPAEVSAAVRRMLGALLEVSRGGGAAGTLSAVARRPPTPDIGALVAEIEAALIPVNRGAARRALARLARETARARDEGYLAAASSTSQPPPEPQRESTLVPSQPPPERDEDTEPIRVPTPIASVPPAASNETPRQVTPTPPTAGVESVPPPGDTPSPQEAAPKPLTRADELLARFSGSVVQSDQEIARELKAMVGIEPTPPPPEATAEPSEETVVETAEPPPVDEVSESPPSFDMPLDALPPRRSKAGLLVVLGIVVLGVGALAAFFYYPELFSGK